MADMKEIYDFAVKWRDKFKEQGINYIELVDRLMADDCQALGFEMDCGHAFSEKYGDAATNHEALGKIIYDVTDIFLLGSAIYSRWYYFNHWSHTGAEILEPENCAWFILALSRLVLLTEDEPFVFPGALEKVSIISRRIIEGPLWPYIEAVQHLIIDREGHVSFSGYDDIFDEERGKKTRSKDFKIEKLATDKLFGAIETYFSKDYTETLAMDAGDWVLELTNTEGDIYRYRGILSTSSDYGTTALSKFVRETVGMDDLYVFDGKYELDVITKITLDYYRHTKIKPDQKLGGEDGGCLTWVYTEHLIIDREKETLEHIQNNGAGRKLSKKYEIEGGIKHLLDSFYGKSLFSHIKGSSEDVIDPSNESRDYTITIEYKKNPSRIITGSYDKSGLPEDFAEFAKKVLNFMRMYDLGEILDPSVYGEAKRRKPEYIFCSVRFNEGYNTYYYLTEDDSIEVGDLVLVPAGRDNHGAVVEVANIEYFSEENAPLPLEKIKRIIRKCRDDDIGLPVE